MRVLPNFFSVATLSPQSRLGEFLDFFDLHISFWEIYQRFQIRLQNVKKPFTSGDMSTFMKNDKILDGGWFAY